jgi:hypothetical protein
VRVLPNQRSILAYIYVTTALWFVYTDDCLIFAKNDCTINDLAANLSKTFLLEDQGTVQDYLGIRIQKDKITKTISMTQTGLIESIISDVGLTLDSNTKTTPSDSIL